MSEVREVESGRNCWVLKVQLRNQAFVLNLIRHHWWIEAWEWLDLISVSEGSLCLVHGCRIVPGTEVGSKRAVATGMKGSVEVRDI